MTEIPELQGARSLTPQDRTHGGRGLDTPEAVVEALYETLSGPAELEQERDWDRLRALCLPGARFLIARWPDADGNPAEDLREWDVEGFIADAKRFYRDEAFWEREVWGRTERFGRVAHRFSSYESIVGSPDSEPAARGINSFQLVRYGGRWWLVNVAWDVESPGQPIPEEYLDG